MLSMSHESHASRDNVADSRLCDTHESRSAQLAVEGRSVDLQHRGSALLVALRLADRFGDLLSPYAPGAHRRRRARLVTNGAAAGGFGHDLVAANRVAIAADDRHAEHVQELAHVAPPRSALQAVHRVILDPAYPGPEALAENRQVVRDQLVDVLRSFAQRRNPDHDLAQAV